MYGVISFCLIPLLVATLHVGTYWDRHAEVDKARYSLEQLRQSHFLTLVFLDKMGLDKMRLDEMGINHLYSRPHQV